MLIRGEWNAIFGRADMERHILIVLFAALLHMAPGGLSAQELISQERWPDGTLSATRYSDGGRIHFITYHENGQVKEVGCFLNGRRDGVWKQYNDTGVLLARAGFHNGARQGVWQFRNDADSPVGKLTYSAGRLMQGEEYEETGVLAAHRTY